MPCTTSIFPKRYGVILFPWGYMKFSSKKILKSGFASKFYSIMEVTREVLGQSFRLLDATFFGDGGIWYFIMIPLKKHDNLAMIFLGRLKFIN